MFVASGLRRPRGSHLRPQLPDLFSPLHKDLVELRLDGGEHLRVQQLSRS